MVVKTKQIDWKKENILHNSTLKARIGWQGLTTSEYLLHGDYYLVGGTDFKNGRIDWENCFYVSKERYDQDTNIQLNEGDVLVTKDGTIGKIAFVEELPLPATLNSGVFVIRPKKESYVSKYLFYVLSSDYFDRFLNKLKAGSTIAHLYQKDFVSFDFILPKSKKEQAAIAEVLSDTDELIEAINELIEKKKMIKQGAMQELLIGKRRLPGFKGEWEEEKLGDIFTLTAGQTKSKFIQESGRYIIMDMGSVSTEGKNISNKYTNHDKDMLQEGDLIMPKDDIGGGFIIGRTVHIDENNKYILGDHVYRLRIKDTNSYSLFYSYLINGHEINCSFRSKATGSAQIGLNRKSIEEQEVKVPVDIKEQASIAEVLSNMDVEIEELEQKRDKYMMIKKGMMQELLTGRRRLK